MCVREAGEIEKLTDRQTHTQTQREREREREREVCAQQHGK